jgi:hypothetical protein
MGKTRLRTVFNEHFSVSAHMQQSNPPTHLSVGLAAHPEEREFCKSLSQSAFALTHHAP